MRLFLYSPASALLFHPFPSSKGERENIKHIKTWKLCIAWRSIKTSCHNFIPQFPWGDAKRHITQMTLQIQTPFWHCLCKRGKHGLIQEQVYMLSSVPMSKSTVDMLYCSGVFKIENFETVWHLLWFLIIWTLSSGFAALYIQWVYIQFCTGERSKLHHSFLIIFCQWLWLMGKTKSKTAQLNYLHCQMDNVRWLTKYN